jgi:hypothetical protein
MSYALYIHALLGSLHRLLIRKISTNLQNRRHSRQVYEPTPSMMAVLCFSSPIDEAPSRQEIESILEFSNNFLRRYLTSSNIDPMIALTLSGPMGFSNSPSRPFFAGLISLCLEVGPGDLYNPTNAGLTSRALSSFHSQCHIISRSTGSETTSTPI